MTTRFEPFAGKAVLILAHDGVGDAALDVLEQAGLPLGIGQDAALTALAQGWDTLAQFGPLHGHRQNGAPLTPAQPWFGAEQTDPDLLLQRLGEVVLPGLFAPFAADASAVVGVVSRQMFWTLDEALRLCRFFLTALPDSVLLIPQGADQAARDRYRAQTGWSEDAAVKAIDTMNGHAGAIVDAFGDRTILWQMDQPLPPETLAALGLAEGVRA